MIRVEEASNKVFQPEILDLLQLPMGPRNRGRLNEIAETYRISNNHFVFVASSRTESLDAPE
jgi:hypothetical protein